jgi:hypothetical protein
MTKNKELRTEDSGLNEKQGSGFSQSPVLAPQSLPSYITAHLAEPFKYGVNDCVLFAVGWAERSTGKRFLPSVLWTNEQEALFLVEQMGGLEAAFTQNFTRIEPNFARDGDLAIADGIAYLFSGPHIVGVGKDGLVFKSRLEAQCAFSFS